MEGSSKQLPTLAPGPPGGGAVSALPPSRPKKNSTACLACKQAKRKVSVALLSSCTISNVWCIGCRNGLKAFRCPALMTNDSESLTSQQCSGRPSPCKACESTDSECIFDETLDLRRKVAMKRTVDELEGYKELLYSLLETLRSGEPTAVDRLMTMIRNSASLSDIAAAVSDNIRAMRSKVTPASDSSSGINDAVSKADRLQRLSESYFRRRFLVLENLCDIPLFDMAAKPWTNVTDDSQFISHLISLYFTWNHPCSQFIDQQCFLQHMASGNSNSQYCTPFLVNSLLAVASVRCCMSIFFHTLAHGDVLTWIRQWDVDILRFSRGICHPRRFNVPWAAFSSRS